MSRLNVIKKMEEVEVQLERVRGLKRDFENSYTKKVVIYAELETSLYVDNRRYDGKGIDVNYELFMDYLKIQENALEKKMETLIDELTKQGSIGGLN